MSKEEKIVGQCKSSVSKEYLKALYTFNYIMTRCEDEDSYIIKFPLGIQEGTTFGEDMEKAYKVIKEALQRLESIDNANPSEAMEDSLKLYKMVESAGNGNGFNLNEAWEYHNTIKQALIKAQEQEKVLKIIKEKEVDTFMLMLCDNVEQYNSGLKNKPNRQLTEEEFELLKRYCDEKDKTR